jgi:predicted GTPase
MHGEMGGAGVLRVSARRRLSIRDLMRSAPSSHVKTPPPAQVMGYGVEQMRELGETINNTPCDLVLVATPIDLRRVVEINRPSQRVRYELQEIGQPTLADLLEAKFGRKV